MSKMTDTAIALVAILADGDVVQAEDLRYRITAEGGDPAYLQDAAKHLRDMGIPIIARKARHLSNWRIAQSGTAEAAADSEKWSNRVRKEHYSEVISTARALSRSTDTSVQAVRQTVILSAINLGLQMGKTIDEVVAECAVPSLSGSKTAERGAGV